MRRIELVIEEAQSQDAVAFIDFMDQVSQETDFLLLDAGEFKLTAQEMAQIFAQSWGSSYEFFLLAKVAQTVIGLIHIKTGPSYQTSHIGEVFMAVRQAYWGHGIGSILMEEALAWVQVHGQVCRLALTVQARNQRALGLYRKFGFEIEGTQVRGLRTNEGEFLDVYAMAKLIEE